MKKYTARVNCIDNDYHSWVGDELIQVNSWKEAEDWARVESWSGHYYSVETLKDNKTNKIYRSRKELNDAV